MQDSDFASKCNDKFYLKLSMRENVLFMFCQIMAVKMNTVTVLKWHNSFRSDSMSLKWKTRPSRPSIISNVCSVPTVSAEGPRLTETNYCYESDASTRLLCTAKLTSYGTRYSKVLVPHRDITNNNNNVTIQTCKNQRKYHGTEM